jgi:hypothetical protein
VLIFRKAQFTPLLGIVILSINKGRRLEFLYIGGFPDTPRRGGERECTVGAKEGEDGRSTLNSEGRELFAAWLDTAHL